MCMLPWAQGLLPGHHHALLPSALIGYGSMSASILCPVSTSTEDQISKQGRQKGMVITLLMFKDIQLDPSQKFQSLLITLLDNLYTASRVTPLPSVFTYYISTCIFSPFHKYLPHLHCSYTGRGHLGRLHTRDQNLPKPLLVSMAGLLDLTAQHYGSQVCVAPSGWVAMHLLLGRANMAAHSNMSQAMGYPGCLHFWDWLWRMTPIFPV